MPNMDVWEWALVGMGTFVAVTVLVRLMRQRRDAVLGELTAQAHEEQRRQQSAEMQEKRKAKRVA
jgi:hypothetical protein